MKWYIGSAALNFKLYGKTNILTLLLRGVAFIPWAAQLQVVRSSFRENIWLTVWVAVSGCRASVWEVVFRQACVRGTSNICENSVSEVSQQRGALGRVICEGPAETETWPQSGGGGGQCQWQRQETGWQQGDEWLPSSQGRTQEIRRAEVRWLRTWGPMLEDAPPFPLLQQTWSLRGPPGAPRHGEGSFPFRDLTVASMHVPSWQIDGKEGWWYIVVRM